ncbi:MAG: helix-turn-helix domain-containing protein [Candidatus Poribacteria bacterium]|nr:helix-turn-helix domain-containing protein [Candidatus Poribacteria bacterium]
MWLDMNEAAFLLKVSRRTLQRQVAKNSIKNKKEGRRRLVWVPEQSTDICRTTITNNQKNFELRTKISDLEEKVGHLSRKLSQMSDKADGEQSLIKIKDQQIEKLQHALDQEQELNVIGQRNMENLSNQIEAQRQQLEEWQRLTPLMARLRAAFLTE